MYDVAIVGFGPAGVVAAALLGQAGLRVHVCDRMADIHEIPRAIALDHEILRVFQQLGASEAVAPHVEPFTPSEYYGVDGQLIRRLTMVEPPYPLGHTPSVVFTQPPVERALRRVVASLPNVTVALRTELTGLSQDEQGVTLVQRDAQGAVHEVRAAWAIACDGGGSTVRNLLGVALEDLAFDEPWLVVDAMVNERGLARLPKTSVQYCEPERPATFVIGPGKHRRWEISLNPGEDPQQVATPQGTWALLSRWMTPDDGVLWRQSSYRFHALVAERWRDGRIFLAGDAAHMQPPFIGQGMCQGIRDVSNLSWKLVSVARGEVSGAAADRLLDSYQIERKAHVCELIARIKAIGAVICERDVERARERDMRLLQECGGVVRDTPRQDLLPRLEGGLLSSRVDSARGTLFPQPRMVGGELMDRHVGCGWRLVLAAAGLPAVAPPGISVLTLGAPGMQEADGVLAAWFERHRCRAALVRPDHYVFGTAADAGGLDVLLSEFDRALH